MILCRRHLYHEIYKLSQNFTEGNTRKISAFFLRQLICDVIKSRNDHARMRINDPLASFARASRKRIVISSYVLPKTSFRNIMTHFQRGKFRTRNSYPMDSQHLVNEQLWLLKFDFFFLFRISEVHIHAPRARYTTQLVGE